jgi:hypothetical protein
MPRERISMEMVLKTYDDPDTTRTSSHGDLREIRGRWFGEEGIEWSSTPSTGAS